MISKLKSACLQFLYNTKFDLHVAEQLIRDGDLSSFTKKAHIQRNKKWLIAHRH